MVYGEGFGDHATVEVASQEKNGGSPAPWVKLASVESSRRCVKALLPADWKPGVFACRVRLGDVASGEKAVNAPVPWWVQGDMGASGTPGGWLRVLGKCLTSDVPTVIILKSRDGAETRLQPRKSDPWSLAADLPDSLANGDYEVIVSHGGSASAGHLLIAPSRSWKSEVFDVQALGGKIQTALDRVKANGGGVIYFSRGRYTLPGPLELPPGTVLQGEGMELVSLIAPIGKRSSPWIQGSAFEVRDLSIYVEGEHGDIITDSPDSEGVKIERVRIRANSHFMTIEGEKAFRGHVLPKSQFVNGAAISFRGRGFQVTDCDIYAANRAMWFRGTRHGFVARNKFSYGGRAHGWDHLDGLIFEENEIAGNSLNSIGNDITTFWGKACENIYYARNRVHDVYGGDREMITLDAGGGAYCGRVARVEGLKMILQEDPHPHPDHAWSRPEDWRRAVVLVLDGKGAGQWRRVVKHHGRVWELNAPWEVDLDETSMIQITYFRGRHLFVENEFSDGGPVQMYGCAIENILAGNRGSRMDGFLVQGLNPHGYGFQPSWFCQFLGNEVAEGNGFGGRGGGIWVSGGGSSEAVSGPMARGIVLRGNTLRNNASISVGGASEDVILENCAVSHVDSGIRISETTRGVFLRGNTFDAVTHPVVRIPVPQRK